MHEQIVELDSAFRNVNFGQPITDQAIDQYKPSDLNKDTDRVVYRDWKKMQILLKRIQMQQRE